MPGHCRALPPYRVYPDTKALYIGCAPTLQPYISRRSCAVMALGILQPLNALLRPHKKEGEARSTARLAWEVRDSNNTPITIQ